MKAKPGLKIIIADDHNLFRQGLARLLSEYKDFGPIQEAQNGMQLLEKMKEEQPDVVLLDLNMPVMNGLTAMPIICKDFPEAKVIIISMYKEAEFIAKLIKDGASGYLLKDADIEEVATAIRTVANGNNYINEVMSKALVNQLRDVNKNSIYAELGIELTRQEKALLRHIASQKTNHEIADQMSLSIRTVEFYRGRLMSKLGVKNSTGLMAYAMKHLLPE